MAGSNRGLFEDATPSYRGMFAIIFAGILGMAVIIGGKQWGIEQLFLTAIPIGIMIVYAVLLRLPFLRLRDDHSGDNLYYLGFLYTLTSIAASLMSYTAGGSADIIVANFGIAVFTTIAGLLLRVAFNQMRSDPGDVERTTRLELAEAARKMRTELDSATLELKQFHRATLQSMDGSFTSIRSFTEDSLKALVSSAEEFTRSSSDMIKSRDALFVENTTKLNKALTSATKAIDKVGSQLDLFKSPETLVTLELGPAKKTLEDFTTSLVQSHDQVLASVRSSVDQITQSTRALEDLVKATQTTLRAMANDQSSSAAQLSASTQALNQAALSIRDLLSVLQRQPPRATQFDDRTDLLSTSVPGVDTTRGGRFGWFKRTPR
jgi:hypothetical protein